MYQKVSVLIIEDEKSIRDFISKTLSSSEYKVATAANGKDGMALITSSLPDLVLLDLGLPDMDGLEIIKKTREWSSLPIIVISARTQEKEKVHALDAGADDYITKPFAIEELLARIRVTLKHRNTRTAESEKLIAGKLCLDTASRQVTYDGNEIQLTNREFILLQTLMENRSIVLSRDTLLTKVWGYDYIGETNVVDVYIYYLRSKIDDVFGEKIIETVRGAGYIIK